MAESCMVCLEESGRLWPLCAPGTCHNLKIHPECYIGWVSNSRGSPCTICDRPHPVRYITLRYSACPFVSVVVAVMCLCCGWVCGAMWDHVVGDARH